MLMLRHYNENDEIIGYQSVRCKPTRQQVQTAERLYQEINQGKLPKRISTKQPNKTTFNTAFQCAISTCCCLFN